MIIMKVAAYYSTADRPPYVWHDDSNRPTGKQIKDSDKKYGKPAGYTHYRDCNASFIIRCGVKASHLV